MTVTLFHQLVTATATRYPEREAVRFHEQSVSYAQLAAQMERVSAGLLELGLLRCERVAVYLEKRIETVVALFGASLAGAVFVPVNPLLKADQVGFQLLDCQVKMLVTTAQRFEAILAALMDCPDLETVILIDHYAGSLSDCHFQVIDWEATLGAPAGRPVHRCIDQDLAAILYTSGSTGKPKGVMLSHRNLVSGAMIVGQFLHNVPEDRVLCVLPLSFDYGLSQLSTVFLSGGTAVLLNYLMPVDVLNTVRRERITGLAGIPPLWGQLAQLDWSGIGSLRYLTNSGGVMPGPLLAALRSQLPDTRIYLMFGLTEAFRSTFLAPELVDQKPDSIGKAIANNEVRVLRPDGTECDPDEPGELVHRGSLVALGYWNRPEQNAQRFKPIHPGGLPCQETAVWSGDLVRRDQDGFLYYVGRREEQIKVSGYRISPQEVEEVLTGFDGISELAVIGVAHPLSGQAIVAVVAQNGRGVLTDSGLRRHCLQHLPAYMVPAHFAIEAADLPKNPNGKINRQALQLRFSTFFQVPS